MNVGEFHKYPSVPARQYGLWSGILYVLQTRTQGIVHPFEPFQYPGIPLPELMLR
jgi:hypothetical protein